MREIKFRIWCKQTDEMHAVERMGFEEGELWYVEDENRETDPPYFMDRNDSVLMQYTGLKDKNGREIYEGDIVKYGDCSGGGGFDYYETVNVGVVEYDNETISYFFTNRDTVEMHEIDFDEVEVIGNIYENPELIDAQ